jgi:hypothetical protein
MALAAYRMYESCSRATMVYDRLREEQLLMRSLDVEMDIKPA